MGLHLEERADGSLALYMDGDLQFDTHDEAYYHECLALPALCLAQPAEPGALRVTILGGGDGLALRECLRFPGVARVTLVDYSDEVIDLARGRLAELNHDAFADPRVTVVCGDAWDYLAQAEPCDVLLVDLTVPRRTDECRLHTREGYARMKRVLAPGGVAAINGLSPQRTPEAFWCLRRTMRAAGLYSLPYRVPLPSFWAHGYGVWSFFLAARRPLRRRVLADLACPVPTRQADLSALYELSRFARGERHLKALVPTNTLAAPCLLPLILNPRRTPPPTMLEAEDEPYRLDGLLSALSILHPYHTREMVETLAADVVGTVRRLDLDRLVQALLERAARLPDELVDELRRLREFLRGRAEGLERLGLWCQRVLVILYLVVTMANLLSPDNVFAKGSFGAHGSFGHVSATHSSSISSAHVSGHGFGEGYGRGHVTDIEGHTSGARRFRYDPDTVHLHLGFGYHGSRPAPSEPEQNAVIAAASDVLVMENGDVVVTLADDAFLVASQGQVSLLSTKSGAPLAALYADPDLFKRLGDEVNRQRGTVSRELELRRDWLGWVGWARFLPTVKADRLEAANLDDAGQRLDKAVQRLGTPASSETLIAPDPASVELFVGGYLQPDGRVMLRQPDKSWLSTDGRHLDRGDSSQPCPPELATALRSVMAKLDKDTTADLAATWADLSTMDKDLVTLKSDLAEYQRLSGANGSTYYVDYGTDQITAQDAIARTERDIAQTQTDRDNLAKEADRMQTDLGHLHTAAPRFVVLEK